MYDLNRSGLENFLASDPVSPAISQAIIDYLKDDGLLHGHDTVAVQVGGTLDPTAQVYVVDNPTASISVDANLKVIIDDAGGQLNVIGKNDVLIATGSSDVKVDLTGSSGNDVVVLGSGNNTVLGGTGADSVYGGTGNDTLQAGGGDHQLLQGGKGNDQLIGGHGDFDTRTVSTQRRCSERTERRASKISICSRS